MFLPLSRSTLVGVDKKGNARPGRPLTDIADGLDRALAKGANAGFAMCARMMQVEVVKRCPVLTGQMKAAFSSPDAVGKNEDGKWAFGLLTPELRRAAHYWQYVEYGTKSKPARVKVTYDRATRRTRRRKYPATAGRSPHPFFRPGIAVARTKFTTLAGMGLGMGLSSAFKELRGAPEGPTITYQIGLGTVQQIVKKYREDDRL